MKRRCNQAAAVDVSAFADPYTGIAAMILFQALDDLKWLGDRDVIRRNGTQISKGEIIQFWQSTWALNLVEMFGYDISLLRDIVREATA